MSYTQAQLDALRAAVAQGVREVTVDGRRVVYSTTDEMLRLIAVIERSLARAAGRRVTGRNPIFRRGI